MYGSVRASMVNYQENALRIAINAFNRIANENSRGIEVLMAFQSEFYMRAYLRVSNKRSACWDSMTKTGIQFYCGRCCNSYIHNFGSLKEGTTNQYKSNKFKLPTTACQVCGSDYEMNGPIWTGKLYNDEFVKKLYDNLNELETKKKEDLNDDLKNMVIVSGKKIKGLCEGIIEEIP